ncbi:MAG: hypothetical protein AB8E15_01430 [Bdellovibrionales bacterium]
MIVIFSFIFAVAGVSSFLSGLFLILKNSSIPLRALGVFLILVGSYWAFTNIKFLIEFLKPKEVTKYYISKDPEIEYLLENSPQVNPSSATISSEPINENTHDCKTYNTSIGGREEFGEFSNKTPKNEQLFPARTATTLHCGDKKVATITLDHRNQKKSLLFWRKNPEELISINLPEIQNPRINDPEFISSKTVRFSYGPWKGKNNAIVLLDIEKVTIAHFLTNKKYQQASHRNNRLIGPTKISDNKYIILVPLKPVPHTSTSSIPAIMQFVLFNEKTSGFTPLFNWSIKKGIIGRISLQDSLLLIETSNFFQSTEKLQTWEYNIGSLQLGD